MQVADISEDEFKSNYPALFKSFTLLPLGEKVSVDEIPEFDANGNRIR